ncbi:MAG: protein-glutamate O-methyltransferase CheR [Deltaproteobacteria bacterium]|nr:protein-glutamate O-methyltransferase CheR [Deltaproteobacteria bacterium]
MNAIAQSEFLRLQEYLHSASGIDVSWDKRYLFETRLGELLNRHDNSFASLCDRLEDDRALGRRLVELMTTGETAFFRDGHPFSTLRRKIFPELAAQRSAEALRIRPRLRVLSLGCSTGEEPYSVAACLHAWLDTQDVFEARDVSVLAIDISPEALRHALDARYPATRFDTLPPEYRVYFEQRADVMLPLPGLRSSVVFHEANLVDPLAHLGCFDVVLCRNVIIYFDLEMRRRVIASIFEMLRPQGVLLLGASENLYQISDAFRLVQFGSTSFYRKEYEP